MSQRAFVGRVVTVLVLVGLAWLVVWFVQQITEIMILLLISAILASGFAPLVEWIERWPLPRGMKMARGIAIAVLYVALFAALGFVVSMIGIPAVAQGRLFVQRLPLEIQTLQVWLANLQSQYRWLPDLAGMISRLPAELGNFTRYGVTAATVLFSFIGGLAAAIAVLVFAYYMLLGHAAIKGVFLALLPPAERPRGALVLARIGTKFGAWFRGQFLLMLITSLVVSAFLLAIGMPYAFLLGILTGIGELVPILGLWIGAAATALVALSQPHWRLFAIIAFFTVYMNFEPHVLVPRIMYRAVGLSPLLVIFALISGIKLAGIIGGLLAVPVAAALQVIFSEIAAEIQSPHETPEAPRTRHVSRR
ncbi:MAG TPA: AI-2E family transporter [bacterium]|nr:AI-2E family transporter [bacterium]